MEAEYAGGSSKGNLMRKIHYLKEVIQLLKTIQGTEEERKKGTVAGNSTDRRSFSFGDDGME